MFRPLVQAQRRIRLVHGEFERASALAEGLRGIGFADVAVPESGERLVV